LIALFAVAAYAQTAGTFGTTYSCSAAGQYTFALSQITGSTWSGSLSVNIACSGSSSGSWSVDSYSTITSWATLQAHGFNALSLAGSLSASTNVGFSVMATAGTTVTATITTPDITLAIAFANIIATITGQATAQAGFVQVDASGNAQFVFPAMLQSVGIAGKALTATVTVTGGASAPTTNNYVISTINLSVPNSMFTANLPVTANANQTYVFTSDLVADGTASLQLFASTSAMVKCTTSATATSTPPATMGTWLKVFLQIDTSDSTGAMTTYNGQATISYQYTTADLTAVGLAASQASNLKFAYYSSTSMSWTPVSSSVSGGVLATSTTHFSQWGMYASNTAAMLNANFLLVMLAALFSYLLA